MFDSREYEYADVKVSVLGVNLSGLRGLTYKKSQEKEPVYGQGNSPKAIQRGNKKYEGTLMLLKSDFDLINDAARDQGYDDILDIPYKDVDITCTYAKEDDSNPRTDVCKGVAFTEYEEGMKQGDKFKEVSIPFIFLELKKG
jgi:hypothetical protein